MFNFDLLSIIISIPAAMLAFTVQGYARALVADKLGDKMPRFQGRLTMNPLAHLDPIGFIMILLVGFGWTKPVETNPRAYKRGYKDCIKVAIAAPIANFIVAFLGALLSAFIYSFLINVLPDSIFIVIYNMILNVLWINVSLGVFTLLPLPGLAGFEIFKELFPKAFYKYGDMIYQYQMFILIGIILLGQGPLGFIVKIIANLFSKIAWFIF